MAGQSDIEKALLERQTFRRFIGMLQEEAMWQSIESRPPREPDLLCKHVNRGYIAFELVSITDPNIARAMAEPWGDGLAFEAIDPTERIIKKKLTRSYETNFPIELLVYNSRLVVTSDEAIINKTLYWLNATHHTFERVWFMGEFVTGCIWPEV